MLLLATLLDAIIMRLSKHIFASLTLRGKFNCSASSLERDHRGVIWPDDGAPPAVVVGAALLLWLLLLAMLSDDEDDVDEHRSDELMLVLDGAVTLIGNCPFILY